MIPGTGAFSLPRYRMGGSGVGLSGLSDDLNELLRQATSSTPEMRQLGDTAAEQVANVVGENAGTLDLVGGILKDTTDLVNAASGSADKERIANASLTAIAAAANIGCPGLGSAIQMAVQILWRLVSPALEELSSRMAYITKAQAYRNAFLRVTGYNPSAPVGGRGNKLDVESMAEAYRDGWLVMTARATNGYPFGALTFVSLAKDVASLGYDYPPCANAILRSLASGSSPLLEESARAVDTMFGSGDTAGATELWNKTLDLLDKTFPNGKTRLEKITGINAQAIVGAAPYPWGGTRSPGPPISFSGSGMIQNTATAPRTKEEAARIDRNLLLYSGCYVGETHGSAPERADMIAFKQSRIPIYVAGAVAHAIFADPASGKIPCDAWIQRLTSYGQGKVDDIYGPVSVWGMKLVENVSAVMKAAEEAEKKNDSKKDTSEWTSGDYAIAGGATLGVAALITKLLKLW